MFFLYWVVRIQTDKTGADLDQLQSQIKKQDQEIESLRNEQAAVKKVFTTNQIKKLSSHRRINWSVTEISNSIAMYAAGPRAYRLSLKKGFPYPAVSTLKQWLRKIQLDQGILKNILKIAEFADMSQRDRICTIMFDEMKIRREYAYDQVKDCVLPPYNYVQVVLISGLFKAWKQPIFFDFDCKMTSSILMEIISFVENSGKYFNVY